MPKLELDSIPETNRTGYPAPFDRDVAGRWHRSLSEAGGLVDFGARHVRIVPGAWSSQRHWHEGEDELVIVISGEATLIENGGRTRLIAGDVAVFPKDVADGHHLVNESAHDCVFVAIGRNAGMDCHYSDIDLRVDGATGRYVRKDGTPC